MLKFLFTRCSVKCENCFGHMNNCLVKILSMLWNITNTIWSIIRSTISDWLFINQLFLHFQAQTEHSGNSANSGTGSRGTSKYTPLGALANLQPGNNGENNHKTQHHTAPVTGLVQPLQGKKSSSGNKPRDSLQSSDSHQQHGGSSTSSRFSSTIQHQGNYVLQRVILNLKETCN